MWWTAHGAQERGIPDRSRQLRALAIATGAGGIACAVAAGVLLGDGVNPMYLLALVAIVGFGALSLVEPQLAVAAAVAIGMGRISDVAISFAGAPSIFKPIIAFLVLLVVVQVFNRGYRSLACTRTLGIMLAFLLAQTVSALLATDVTVAMGRVDDLGRDFLIVFLVACLMRTTSGVRFTVWALVGLGAFLSALTLYQATTMNFSQQFFGMAQAYEQHIVDEISQPRSSGPFGDPNFFAQYLVVFAALSVFRAMDERSMLLRLVGVVAFIMNVGALIFTYSRGGLLAFGVVMMLLVWVRRPSRTMIIMGIVVAVMLLPIVPQTLIDRVTTLTELLPGGSKGAGLEISYRGRMSELLVGLQIFADHPVAGVGPGNSRLWYQDYAADIGLEYRREERTSHNTFLELAAEGGLIGLSLFTFAVLAALADLRSASRLRRSAGDPLSASVAQSILVAICGFLAAGIFLGLDYPRGLWLLMALAIGIRRVAEAAHPASLPGTQSGAHPASVRPGLFGTTVQPEVR